MGLGFLKQMLLPFQANHLGRDVTNNVCSKTERIGNTISERGGGCYLALSQVDREHKLLLSFGVHIVIWTYVPMTKQSSTPPH